MKILDYLLDYVATLQDTRQLQLLLFKNCFSSFSVFAIQRVWNTFTYRLRNPETLQFTEVYILLRGYN